MYEDILAEMKRIELNPQEGDERYANPSLSEEMRKGPVYTKEELSLVPDNVKEKLGQLRYTYQEEITGYDWYEIHGPYEARGQWFGLLKKRILLERVMDDVYSLLVRDPTCRGDSARTRAWFGTLAERWLSASSYDDHIEDRDILQRDILPFIATYSIFRIRPGDLEDILKRITDRGDYERAGEALRIIREIFFFAGMLFRIKCPLPDDFMIPAEDPDSEAYIKAREDAMRSLLSHPLPPRDDETAAAEPAPQGKDGKAC